MKELVAIEASQSLAASKISRERPWYAVYQKLEEAGSMRRFVEDMARAREQKQQA